MKNIVKKIFVLVLFLCTGIVTLYAYGKKSDESLFTSVKENWIDSVQEKIKKDKIEDCSFSFLSDGDVIKTYSCSERNHNAKILLQSLQFDKMEYIIDESESFFDGIQVMMEGTNWKLVAKEGLDYFRIEDEVSSGYIRINNENVVLVDYYTIASSYNYEELSQLEAITVNSSYTKSEDAANAWLSNYETGLIGLSSINYYASSWVSVKLFSLEQSEELTNIKKGNEAEVYSMIYSVYRVPINTKYAGVGGENKYQGNDSTIPEGAWVYDRMKILVHDNNGSWYVRD